MNKPDEHHKKVTIFKLLKCPIKKRLQCRRASKYIWKKEVRDRIVAKHLQSRKKPIESSLHNREN